MINPNLNKNVGKNSRPNPSDVIIVQTCLANIKIKTKSGMKPAWQGKIDGKNSVDLILSIMAFEAHEKLKITGKVEANRGQTCSKLKQKTPQTVMELLAMNLAQATPPSGPKNYTVKSGVKLTPAIEKRSTRLLTSTT